MPAKGRSACAFAHPFRGRQNAYPTFFIVVWLLATTCFGADDGLIDGATDQSFSLAQQSPTPPEDAVPFIPLDARQVGCLAAVRWNPAVGLRRRAQSIRQLHLEASAKKHRAANMLSCFLELQAASQEDIGAASAMRAYYSRIALHEQLDWIDAGFDAVQSQRDKQERLMEHGSAAGVDLSSLERKQIDIREQLLRTNSQLRQLQSVLLGLTDVDFAEDRWLVEPLVVQEMQLNTGGLIALALRERRDLQAWRYLACNVDEDTAPMFISVIASMSGGFGFPVPAVSCLKSCVSRLLHCGNDSATLVQSLRAELAGIVQAHEDWIEQAVAEKAELLQLAYDLHRTEQQRMDSWLGRLEQIERFEKLGETRPDERAAAEAGLLQSQSGEVTCRLDVKLAEVALAEAVGGLATRSCRGEAWLITGK